MNTYPYDDPITYNAFYDIHGERYFSCSVFNGLFKQNIKTRELQYIGKFEGSSDLAINIHRRAYLWREKIVFAPFRCDRVAIFDPITTNIEYIKFGSGIIFATGSLLDGDKLWIFCGSKSARYCMVDLSTHEVWESEPLEEIVKDKVDDYSDIINKSETCIVGNRIYSVIWNTDCYLEFDISSRSFEIHCLGDDSICLFSMTFYNNEFYFALNYCYDIVKYNASDKRISIIENSFISKPGSEYSYCILAPTNKGIVLFPEEGNKIYIIKDGAKTISEMTCYPNKVNEISGDFRKIWRRLLRCDVAGNTIHIAPFRMAAEIEIDLDNGKCMCSEDVFDETFIDNLFEKEYKQNYINNENKKKIIFENKMYQLSDFIK